MIPEIHSTSLGTHLCEHGSFRHFAYQLRHALKGWAPRACVGVYPQRHPCLISLATKFLSMQRGAKAVMCGTSHLVTSSANTRLMCTLCLAACMLPCSRGTWSYNCRWDSFCYLSVKCHAWRGLTCRYASFFSLSSLSFHCSIFSFSVRNWNKHKNIKITQTGRTRTRQRSAYVVHTPSDSRITSCRNTPNLQFWNHFNLLKPTGYVMHHQFNIQQLYALPTLCLCVLYLSENKQRFMPI